jgi:CHAT domain-containing protein/Flp pilus assembly protein TadD
MLAVWGLTLRPVLATLCGALAALSLPGLLTVAYATACAYDCTFMPAEPDEYLTVLFASEVSRGGASSVATPEAFRHLQAADFEQALVEVQQLITAVQAASEPDWERLAAALDFRGVIYQQQGKLYAALESHEKARQVLAERMAIESPQYVAVWNNLAVVHYLLGEYEAAEKWLNAILEHPAVTPQEAARALNNRGLLAQDTGRLDQARLDFDKAQHRAGSDRRLRAQILNNQARLSALDGNLAGAESALQEARQLAQAESDVTLAANILDSWGEVLADAGQPQLALAKLEAAATAEATVKAPLIRGSILKNRGRVLGQLGRVAEALTAYQQALTLAGETGFLALRRETLAARGELHRARGDLDAAIADYREAIQVAEKSRERLRRESEPDFIRATQRLYEAVVTALMQRQQPGDVDEALSFLERSRSATLRQAMVDNSPALRDKQAESELRGARGLLLQEAALVRQLQARLAASPLEQGEIDTLRVQLAQVRAQVGTAMVEIQQRYQGLYDAYVPAAISPMLFKGLKDQLPLRHLLVTFFLATDAVYVFLVSREDGVEFRQDRGVTKRELEQKITEYRQLMTPRRGASRTQWRIDSWTDAQWSALRETTVWLYQHLLAPIADRIEKAEAIMFAPTGLVYYLPLHALGPVDAQTGTIRFLALSKPVSYLTTAALFNAITAAPAPWQASSHRDALLAFGNPLFRGLPLLPNTDTEVTTLQTLFGDRAVVLRGPEATKSALLTWLGSLRGGPEAAVTTRLGTALPDPGQFAFVHLATHGVLDARAPQNSYLALDAGNRLMAHEVASLDLTGTNLITLSACETALADRVPGAELMSLAQFFSAAGARSVVVTLWAVDDVETAHLMEHFYRGLKENPTEKARALQQAQAALMTRPESRHPYFWAPFMLVGAPR